MADQMRMGFQREREEINITIRQQLGNEHLEEVRREMIALMNGPDEHPFSSFQSSQQPPPPPSLISCLIFLYKFVYL
ncbi:hypothetical protein L484_018319 [Morus notabilis]|uniref:Uncharacterized protein n=1 Tax=Morus notabilis TaxID=981085 RepID=W9QRD1_9ROSA|nr:hypothetical protein L484_018319 [Morus notabilis]